MAISRPRKKAQKSKLVGQRASHQVIDEVRPKNSLIDDRLPPGDPYIYISIYVHIHAVRVPYISIYTPSIARIHLRPSGRAFVTFGPEIPTYNTMGRGDNNFKCI